MIGRRRAALSRAGSAAAAGHAGRRRPLEPCGMLSAEMIDRVALDALLLKAQFPELTLREGARVVARVASRGEHHGVIVLAGVPLTAELPPGVRAGETLHLRVQEATDERVTLRLDPQAAPPPPAPAPHAPPRGARLAVADPPRRLPGAGEDAATVALAFDSAVLGRLDLRIDLAAGTVRASVETPAGRTYDLAHEAAARLQDALAGKIGRPAAVRVTARREPFDAYA
jgi:hypothetical protein